MKPIIISTYNNQIDPRIAMYQKMVIDKFRHQTPFLSINYPYTSDEMLHGDILNKYVHHAFYTLGADCILLLDVDAVPLSTQAVITTLHYAYQNYLVGNIQRSNHYNNQQHTYCAPSYCCFTREVYEAAGSPTMSYNSQYDTGELLTVNAAKNSIPIIKFMPTKIDAPINPQGEYWDLADGMPKYGIGTTFSFDGNDISYHLFSSRDHIFNNYFFDRCHSLIMKSEIE